jgi:hypothetical protein
MWSFRGKRLLEPVDIAVASMMAALGRFQGRQELYQHQAPQLLETLHQIAMGAFSSSGRQQGRTDHQIVH